MPYLLQQYSSALVGPARGHFQLPQLAPCCGKSPWWAGVEGANDQLNAALSGAVTRDWKIEIEHLTNLVSGKGFGVQRLGGFHKWNKSQQEHYRSSWKVLTVFLGMNDVLTNSHACSENASQREAIVSAFRGHMTSLFDHLVADSAGVFGKLYVNLGMLFATSNIGLENAKRGWCKSAGRSFFKGEFPCSRSGGDIQRKGELVDNVTRQMNEVLVELAAKYDQKRPDFAVNLFETSANQQITHEDLRSNIDCFHPTAKAHRILGTALWNSMLIPSRPQAFDALESTPACADANTRLVTYRRSASASTTPASSSQLLVV